MFKPGKQDAVNFTGIPKSGSTQDAAMPIVNQGAPTFGSANLLAITVSGDGWVDEYELSVALMRNLGAEKIPTAGADGRAMIEHYVQNRVLQRGRRGKIRLVPEVLQKALNPVREPADRTVMEIVLDEDGNERWFPRFSEKAEAEKRRVRAVLAKRAIEKRNSEEALAASYEDAAGGVIDTNAPRDRRVFVGDPK